jgi:hypothetical protein
VVKIYSLNIIRHKGREDEEEDVSNYWMTLRNRYNIGI